MFTTSSLIVVFAISIAYATFIENNYGTETARILIYNASWFNILLTVTGINLIGGLFYYKAFQLRRWSMVLFHLAFIIILVGAGISRFFSYEGNMHIREGQTSDQFVSSDSYINVEAGTEAQKVKDQWRVSFSPYTKNHFNEDIAVGDKDLQIEAVDYVPSATEGIAADEGGKPVLSLILIENNRSSEDIVAGLGEETSFDGVKISFEGDDQNAAFYIQRSGDSLLVKSTDSLSVISMMGVKSDAIAPGMDVGLKPQQMYQHGQDKLVLKSYYMRGQKVLATATGKNTPMAGDALQLRIQAGGQQKLVNLFGFKGQLGSWKETSVAGVPVKLSFGSRLIELPFELKLNDFQLERYPGSMSPSSFASEVTLIDKQKQVEMPYRIFMNNILDYGGFRFFQSSYDTDEHGTILSVSHDFWGTAVTYVGYFLMTLGMIFTFFNKKSRFHALLRSSNRLKELKKKAFSGTILLLLFLVPSMVKSQTIQPARIQSAHVHAFERLLIQDNQGRVEPVNTRASEVLRKLTRKGSFEGMSASEVFLGMSVRPEAWRNVPIIKVANSELAKQLGIRDNFISFSGMIDLTTGGYKLRQLVDQIYKKRPNERNKFDKEVINVDERMNICYQIFTGRFLKIFPIVEDKNNTWVSEKKFYSLPQNQADSVHLLTEYFHAVNQAMMNNDYHMADQKLQLINDFQQKHGSDIFPSQSKINLEILYDQINIFSWLSMICGLLGLYLLIIHLIGIFSEKMKLKHFLTLGTVLVALAFLAYSAGLGVRWYISGHAPWSNGYESMLYVGWATLLSGFVFLKKSHITLAVTTILASLTLMVAGMSWMNPEITNLVPVLKSYWLIVHVAVITASYGFLGVGALLGFLNLLIMIFRTPTNLKNTSFTIVELAIVIELSLLVGLILLTIGAFIGGVWANESWGRYWGWDPKETWALVTILVYSFIIHLRKVPGMNNHYILSSLSLFGFSSVLMTFFGVNYYLSGMHSYGQEDAPPVSGFVYVVIVIVILTVIVAGMSENRFGSAEKIVKLEAKEQ